MSRVFSSVVLAALVSFGLQPAWLRALIATILTGLFLAACGALSRHRS